MRGVRTLPLGLGLAILLAAWAGPLPGLATGSFTAHMALHLAIVAGAAPLLAFGFPGAGAWLSGRVPRGLAALALAPGAAALEMLVVWGWHSPGLCAFARTTLAGYVAEQASWLAIGLLLWMTAMAPRPDGSGGAGPWPGVLALLLTSMHMTLLGSLIALAPGTLYELSAAAGLPPPGLSPLDDQRVGGILMLAVGGAAYLAGGLVLIARALEGEPVTADGAVLLSAGHADDLP